MKEDRTSGEMRWMSTGEAARLLGITVRTLYRLINEGELPAYKLGRVIRLQAADVETFVETARIPPGSLEHLYPDLKRATSASDERVT